MSSNGATTHQPAPGLSGDKVNGNLGDGNVLEPLAIVGFSLKFPNDADSSPGFWKILREKRSVMTEWPEDRINLAGFFMPPHESLNERKLAPGAHFLKEDLGAFDAPFFKTSAGEASAQDLQQRKLLEVSYHALENAGITMEEIDGSQTGVYSGSMCDDYSNILLKDPDDLPTYTASGLAKNMLANRLSWFYNLHGPSVSMDSACSSSLMAFDFACQGLRSRNCNMAIVTGSGVILAPEPTIGLMKMNFLSPNGRSFTFDERANGYSRGEGFSVVVVKRVEDALRDGNVIRAVIRSNGSNQDGHTAGITQPSSSMQAKLIRDTYRKAALSCAPTRFIEAHGTGTALGDPIEADAIGRVFRTSRSVEDPLYVGALKANIGHLEGGSGLAGVIKAVMVLEQGLIPPNANFETMNPAIDAGFLHLKFPTECVPWPSTGLRRASVASFGFGGSNAHVVLDDAYNFLKERKITGRHCTSRLPSTVTRQCSKSDEQDKVCTNGTGHQNGVSSKGSIQEAAQQYRILVLSAADEAGVQRLIESYEHHWKEERAQESRSDYLDHLVYTLCAHRSKLAWRSFALVKSVTSLAQIADEVSKPVLSKAKDKVVFLFTGQGAQYRNMGAGLLAYETFRASIERFDAELRNFGCPWSVISLLTEDDTSSLDIDDPEFSQTATTALQIGLYHLVQAIGVDVDVVIGHSSGEIAAAYAAGFLDLGSACAAAYFRGKLASSMKATLANEPGAMMAVELSEQAMLDFLTGFGSDGALDTPTIACINSPQSVTISGSQPAIDSIHDTLTLRGTRARRIRTGVAYHSPQMEQIAPEYAERLVSIKRDNDKPKKPLMISTVTGKFVDNWQHVCTPHYWVNNMLSPVQFLKAMTTLSSVLSERQTPRLGLPHLKLNDVVEIGPHSTLQRYVTDCLQHNGVSKESAGYYSVLKREVPAIQSVFNLVGKLWAAGYAIDVQKANTATLTSAANPQMLTDLPPYPFNHSKAYWHESAISRHGRMRRSARHELLGVPTMDWMPLEPRWRKFFDLNETPWLAHHQVNDRIIYPAAGMMAMAVEGAAQVADSNRRVAAYELKDVTFTASMPLSTTKRSEALLHMGYDSTHSNKGSALLDFKIYSLGASGWYLNSSGSIRIMYEDGSSGSLKDVNDREQSFYWDKYTNTLKACTTDIPADKFYAHLVKNGLRYGPAFRLLTKAAWDGANTAVGEVGCFPWSADYSQNAPHNYVVHPTVMDAMGHFVWVALTKGCSEIVVSGTAITRVRQAWISNSANVRSSPLRMFCTAETKGLRKTSSTILAFDSADKLAIRISHVETTAIDDTQGSTEDAPNEICFKMDREPDPAFLSEEQLLRLAGPDDATRPSKSFFQDLHKALLYFVVKALKASKGRVCTDRPYMGHYVDMLNRQVRRYYDGRLPHSCLGWGTQIEDEESMKDHIQKLEGTNAEGRFFVHMGRNISGVIMGQNDPLEVMFGAALVREYYEVKCNVSYWLQPLVKYLDLLGRKSPQLKVLEIGAGTGSLSNHVLEALGSNFGRYDYTDVSATFFTSVKDKFARFEPRIQYAALDIESDAATQGFEPGSYDLIVAGWVVHATKDLEKSIRHIRSLIKPGGKLVLLENTDTDNFADGVAFGTLPGWWLGTEPDRTWSPCVSKERWTDLLTKNGFQGVDLVLQDHEDEACGASNILIATATDVIEPARGSLKFETELALVVSDHSSTQNRVASCLREEQVNGEKRGCLIVSMSEVACDPARFQVLVLLLEIDDTYLSQLDQPTFDQLQGILAKAHKVVWVTRSAPSSHTHADHQMVRGLARVLSTEKPGLSFATLSLESTDFDMAAGIRCISQVLSVVMSVTPHDKDLEYTEQDGILLINRISASEDANQDIHSQTFATTKHLALSESPPVVLAAPRSGLLDSLRWEEDEAHLTAVGPDEVELKICAMGINFRDLLVSLGKIPQTTIGCECAGVVTRVGENCKDFNPGDRVCACLIGCSRTLVRCDSRLVAKIPDAMSMAKAASFPCTAITAYYSLVTLANLRSGESILIHSAMGGTGQMMVQLAQSIGAEIYVTVGTEEKRTLIQELYGVPEDHIFNSRDTDFARDIACATNHRGVDVVVNSLSGDALIASWECVAPLGRFIELGKADIENNSRLPMSQFSRNATFFAVSIDYVIEHKPQLIAAALQSSMALLLDGKFRTASPLRIQPISELEDALRHMQSGRNVGKMVMTFDPSDRILVQLSPKYECRFDPRSTYLIAGGLGGLGRSAARWMSQQGAKNLILLGRSGAKSIQAQELLAELRQAGVDVHAPPCDVARAESLADALASCSDLPPIKGCLQATMVLQDALFENMTWSQWSESIRAKVQSTRNLHTQLPRDLSFFVMLSSAGGVVGTMGQANYAAGNVFLDGLAAHRVAVGERAVSIDLGRMAEIGAIASNAATDPFKDTLHDSALISEKEFLALLSRCCHPQYNIHSLERLQPILGLVTASHFLSRGLPIPDMMHRPLFRRLAASSHPDTPHLDTEGDGNEPMRNWAGEVTNASSIAEAVGVVSEALAQRVARSTATSRDEIDFAQPLHAQGVDSLLAVELRNWLKKVFQADVAIFDIVGQSSLRKLAEEATSSSLLLQVEK